MKTLRAVTALTACVALALTLTPATHASESQVEDLRQWVADASEVPPGGTRRLVLSSTAANGDTWRGIEIRTPGYSRATVTHEGARTRVYCTHVSANTTPTSDSKCRMRVGRGEWEPATVGNYRATMDTFNDFNFAHVTPGDPYYAESLTGQFFIGPDAMSGAIRTDEGLTEFNATLRSKDGGRRVMRMRLRGPQGSRTTLASIVTDPKRAQS